MSVTIAASVSPAPKNKALGELKEEVLDIFGSPNDGKASKIAGRGINNAIRRLNSRVWYWTLTYHDITTSLDDADYGLPNDFKATFSMSFLKADLSQNGTADYFDPDTFDNSFPRSQDSGKPVAYTIYNATDTMTLSLNKAPNQSFVTDNAFLRHRYYRKVQEPNDDGDRIIVPSEVELFIVASAAEEYSRIFDRKQWKLLRSDRQETWRQLKKDDNLHHFHAWR